MKSKIIRGITLTMFTTFVIGFVAFRSGYFGGNKSTFPGSPNGSALNNQKDTIPKADTIKSIRMLSSSKVMILRENSYQVNDSDKIKTDTIQRMLHLMHSSKVGPIMRTSDVLKLKRDTLVPDSLND